MKKIIGENWSSLRKLLSWRENPANVFVLVVPLVVMAVICHLAMAMLMWKRDGHPLGLCIVIAGYGSAGVMVWRLLKSRRVR